MASPSKSDLLPGTLDWLILATLSREALHGYAIAQRIQQDSGEVLKAEEGSLYPALQKLLMKGDIVLHNDGFVGFSVNVKGGYTTECFHLDPKENKRCTQA